MLLTCAALWLALAVLTRVGYRIVLYPAPGPSALDLSRDGELRTFTAADGVPVQAMVMRPRQRGGRTVVYFHGNGETIADLSSLGRRLSDAGLRFVAVEYRGYGASQRADVPGPTEAGLYADAEAVLTALEREGLGRDALALWGCSLGSGVAVEMAARGHGSRLVLWTPFTSIPAVAAKILPILPHRLLIADHYDNLAKAGRITVPTLIVHGDSDRMVPYRQGVELSKAIAGAELVTIAGGDHNDLFMRGGETLMDQVLAHLQG